MNNNKNESLIGLCAITGLANLSLATFVLVARNQVQVAFLLLAVMPVLNLIAMVAAAAIVYRKKRKQEQMDKGWVYVSFSLPVLCCAVILWLSGFNHSSSGF
jgi:hypothetical protein